jgi:hypothetical protein
MTMNELTRLCKDMIQREITAERSFGALDIELSERIPDGSA